MYFREKKQKKAGYRRQGKQLCSIILMLALCVSFLFPLQAQADGPYPQWQVIDGSGKTRTCTGYAWSEAYRRFGINMAGLGHARNWLNAARIQGYATGSVPRPNSIAVWEPYALRDLGHVAYVTAVYGNGTMRVNHAGITNRYGRPIGNQGVLYGTVVKSSLGASPFKGNDLHLVGFIYLTSRAVPGVTLIADIDQSNVGHVSAKITAQLSKGAAEKVDSCGYELRKKGAEKGWTKAVSLPGQGVGKGIFFLTCDPQKDWKQKLEPNTVYEVRFYAKIGKKRFQSPYYHFRTSPYHHFGPWKVTKKPTCDHPGEMKSSCSCGKAYVQTLPKRDHWMGNFVLKQPPTCTEEGMLLRKCGFCSKAEVKPVSRTAHHYSAGWQRTEDVHYHVCACGATADFGPHEWEKKRQEDGTEQTVCRICGAIRQAEPEAEEQPSDPPVLWIVLGSLLGLMLLSGGVFLFLRLRKRRKETERDV